jgi:arginyl-tRNA synthetase
MNVLRSLEQRLFQALTGLVDSPEEYPKLVSASKDTRYGDYQANHAMPVGKALGKNPREVAAALVARLDLGDMLEPPTVAGPGFINLRLRHEWLALQMQAIAADPRLGVEAVALPLTIVIDYSSPNVAKPLHVGHLRSSIIGDSLARLLRFMGHHVITDNHLGDWGTQFGILIYGYKNFLDRANYQANPIAELVRLYTHVRRLTRVNDREDVNHPVAVAYRQETARLHAGDAENLALWHEFMPISMGEIEEVYRRLDLLPFDHTFGESFYQPMLAEVVADLRAKGFATESEGAVVVSSGADATPSLVQKSDGAFTYTTTDLATIKYRVEHWHPDKILYVVGAPQALHFKTLFDVARRWGYDKVKFEHVAFGYVLGEDGKILSTRTGASDLSLFGLLDDALDRAREVYDEGVRERRERNEAVPEMAEDEKRQVYDIVGRGAVRYADLCQSRTSNYEFDLKKMTSTDGNTATYMQYAYARNQSILRKAEADVDALRTAPPVPELPTPHERALAIQLLRFPEALDAAAADYRPNHLTSYLWDLTKAYSGFNNHCHVLRAETPSLKQSRLLMCDLTARVIARGLGLLGIQTVERM